MRDLSRFGRLGPVVVMSMLLSSMALAGTAMTATAGPPTPTVTDVGPKAGPNTGTTNVKIIGTGFASGATATFSGIGPVSTTLVSSTQLLVNPPSVTPNFGAYLVQVTNHPSGLRSTQNVFFNYFEALPARVATSLAAVANPSQPARLDVFIRGSDNALWHTYTVNNDGNWNSWDGLGGTLASAPAAVSWQDGGRIDVFVKGGDSGLYHKWWDGSRWNGWENLGGILTSDPGGVSWGPPDRRTGPRPAPRIDLFVRGTDNGVWHKWFDTTAWGGWEGLGGTLSTAPAVSATEVGDLEVFGLGTDVARSLWHLPFFNSWLGWRAEGSSYWTPSVWGFGVGTVSSNILQEVDVMVVTTDGAVWHGNVQVAHEGFGARPRSRPTSGR